MYNFPTPALKKIAIFAHRWTGTAFCLLFSWWFISGIFMMYFDYPEVKESDRLARAQPLEAARVGLSPDKAWAELKTPGAPDEVTLAMFDGHPVYWFRLGRFAKAVYADSGQVRDTFPPEVNLRTAAAWTRQPSAAAKIQAVTAVDQWTVGGIYRRNAPLTKYSWPNGDQVYVAGRTGQVVQFTTRMSRLGAWLGPIPHWLYFTPLRQRPVMWTRIVIWLSGAATVVAILGLIAGLSMYSPSKRYRAGGRPTGIPYAGPKRLHMILGLFFGVLACTWAFSGMLSMDPFPVKSAGESGAVERIAGALGGEAFSFEPFMLRSPRAALDRVGPDFKVKQLEFVIIAGEAWYLAAQDASHSRAIPMNGTPQTAFNRERLVEMAGVHLDETRWMTAYDAYYLDRQHELPLPVLMIQLRDPDQTRLYIDPRTARIVAGYSSSMWAERWLYHGLHSMNLPWLYQHRPAWDIVVLTLMLGGTSLCVTAVIIAWRLLRR